MHVWWSSIIVISEISSCMRKRNELFSLQYIVDTPVTYICLKDNNTMEVAA